MQSIEMLKCIAQMHEKWVEFNYLIIYFRFGFLLRYTKCCGSLWPEKNKTILSVNFCGGAFFYIFVCGWTYWKRLNIEHCLCMYLFDMRFLALHFHLKQVHKIGFLEYFTPHGIWIHPIQVFCHTINLEYSSAVRKCV